MRLTPVDPAPCPIGPIFPQNPGARYSGGSPRAKFELAPALLSSLPFALGRLTRVPCCKLALLCTPAHFKVLTLSRTPTPAQRSPQDNSSTNTPMDVVGPDLRRCSRTSSPGTLDPFSVATTGLCIRVHTYFGCIGRKVFNSPEF